MKRVEKTKLEILEMKKERNQRRNLRNKIDKAYMSAKPQTKRPNPKKDKKARRKNLKVDKVE